MNLHDAAVKMIEHAQEKYPHFESPRGQQDISDLVGALAECYTSPTVAELAAMAPMLTGGEPKERGGVELVKELADALDKLHPSPCTRQKITEHKRSHGAMLTIGYDAEDCVVCALQAKARRWLS